MKKDWCVRSFRFYEAGTRTLFWGAMESFRERGKPMKHSNIAQWTDFIRGLVKGKEQVSMASHLKQGCSQCRRTTAILSDLFTLANADPQDQVPSTVDHLAQLTYGEQQKKHTHFVHRQFRCKSKKVRVDVDFRLNDLWKDFCDVEHCSYFGERRITCRKGCLASWSSLP